jgi:hypothetical protein
VVGFPDADGKHPVMKRRDGKNPAGRCIGDEWLNGYVGSVDRGAVVVLENVGPRNARRRVSGKYPGLEEGRERKDVRGRRSAE